MHPNVLKECGYDPKKVQGYAFGVGLVLQKSGVMQSGVISRLSR